MPDPPTFRAAGLDLLRLREMAAGLLGKMHRRMPVEPEPQKVEFSEVQRGGRIEIALVVDGRAAEESA